MPSPNDIFTGLISNALWGSISFVIVWIVGKIPPLSRWFEERSVIVRLAITVGVSTLFATSAILSVGEFWGLPGQIPGPAGRPGLAGIPGKEGPPGPRGPAGQTDESLRKVLSAIARREWLTTKKKELQNASDRWAKIQQSEIDATKSQDHGRMAASIFDPYAERTLTNLVYVIFDEKINLHAHPRFDQNKNMPTGECESIESSYKKTECTRLYDEINATHDAINDKMQVLTGWINQCDNIILDFGSRKH